MIDFALTTTDGDVFIRQVRDMTERIADLKPLAEAIGRALFAGNEAARQAGLDKDGNPFDEIRPSTVARRRRRGDGNGPALSPNGPHSRVQNPSWAVTKETEYRWTVTLWWPDMPFLKYHVTGTPRMVARNPVGITPETRDAVAALVEDFVAGRPMP